MSCFLWEGFLSSFDFLKNKGEWREYKGARVFFGNHLLSRSDLDKSPINIYDLKQVHGNTIVPSSKKSEEADGHYTDEQAKALIIRTADCMPVFVVSPKRIIALHIGWRGLVKRILSKAESLIRNKKATALFVGPHIRQQSFGLDEKNCAFLLDQHSISFKDAELRQIAIPSFQQKDHYLIDLSQILKLEAEKLGIGHIEISPVDTFTSPQHFSYRRNRFHANRNHSFIVR